MIQGFGDNTLLIGRTKKIFFYSTINKMAEEFTNLPAEVKRIILLNLPIKDIVATCRIDTPFNQLCDDEFWQLVLELHFPGVKTIPGLTNYQTISYILTPKVITIDVSGISDFLAITGDMTIRATWSNLNGPIFH